MSLLEKTKIYVAENIAPGFHDKRLASILKLKLAQALKRKNPYLFRAKAITAAPDLVWCDSYLMPTFPLMRKRFLANF
jgi:hypothetical protein